MRQIASAAGVSRTTVSFVLNDVPGIKIGPETRRRILEVARELNYVADAAATRLAGGRSGTIALILRQSLHQVASDQFLSQVLLGVASAVRTKGFHVLVEPLDPADKVATYGNLVRSRKADGMIISGPMVDDEELFRIHKERIPIVLLSRLPDSTIPYVDVDNVAGACTAVQHLINLGHQRIACITNAPLNYTSSTERLMGYRSALEQAGISFDETLVRYGEFTDESGARAMKDLLGNGASFSAVFVASDVVALGVISVIHAAKLSIPGDVAVVGFDDILMAQYIDPPLTTVRLPAYGLGWGAGEMLMRMVTEQDQIVNSQVVLNTDLIVRKSCGANP
jgi:LacI family transcriptional regulator